jgi:hypothetical protein
MCFIFGRYARFNLISLDMRPEAPSLLERLSNNPQNLGPPTTPPFPGGRGWHVVNVSVPLHLQLLVSSFHPIQVISLQSLLVGY